MDPAELDRILNGLPGLTDPNLLVGISHKDDAAVYRLPSGELIVQTVDFFTPVVDDPYDYGAIAAANSISDIYAMNGRPLFALNICCFPRKYPPEIWHEVLRGGAEKAMEAGIPVVGGHTVDDAEPKYGMVVTGLVVPGRYWTNEGAQFGDALILTKPIGTGLLTTAIKSGTLASEDVADAIFAMKTFNRAAAEVLSRFDVHSCTDITGNGLIGHACEIMEASAVGLDISLNQVPLFKRAAEVAETGKFPGGTFSNRNYYGSFVDIAPDLSESRVWLLFDAQTSGGLLAALPPEQAKSALNELHAAGVRDAAIIGSVTATKRLQITA
ncbi:selenide, water dikinase SelD [candidate division KSB1 bacterium]|nr:MAG: selenide, water dikinase SelD [candidate division KSB1 bacterium]